MISLYQRAKDGFPSGASALLKEACGPIPEAETFQHPSGCGYEKPVQVHGWEWSVTFGRWRALVTFADGWRGATWPFVPHPSLTRFPAAAAQAILQHQAAGKGLRPLSQWDDRDVTDSGILLSALADQGLQGDTYESEIEDVVSPIVFGAFHQDSSHHRIRDAVAILEGGGFSVAELRWNEMATTTICPLTNAQVGVPVGYWPCRQGVWLSLEAFPAEARSQMGQLRTLLTDANTSSHQTIAAYFLCKSGAGECHA